MSFVFNNDNRRKPERNQQQAGELVGDEETKDLPDDLDDLDDLKDPDANDPEHFERPVDKFRKSAAGGALAAGMLGLRDALEGRPERDEVAIVSEAPERELRDRIDVQLDFDDPKRSVVYLEPRDDE